VFKGCKIIEPKEQPKCQAIGGGLSILLEDMTYIFELDGARFKLFVPALFIFDGASIPRLTWSIIGLTPHGSMDGPALPHDFIYHFKGEMPIGSVFIKFSKGWVPVQEFHRKDADKLLTALCKHFKAANRIQARLVWWAVRAFGWAAWRRDDASRKENLLDSSAA